MRHDIYIPHDIGYVELGSLTDRKSLRERLNSLSSIVAVHMHTFEQRIFDQQEEIKYLHSQDIKRRDSFPCQFVNREKCTASFSYIKEME